LENKTVEQIIKSHKGHKQGKYKDEEQLVKRGTRIRLKKALKGKGRTIGLASLEDQAEKRSEEGDRSLGSAEKWYGKKKRGV